MKVVTVIAVLILIAGVMVIFLPEIIRMTHPTHSMSSELNQIGSVFASAGSPEVASMAYDSALSLEPDNFDSLMNKGDVLTSSGKHLEALTVYSKALNKKPDSVAVMKKKSDVLKTLGRIDESNALLMNIVHTHSSDQSDQLTIAKSSMLTGDYQGAIEKIDSLLKEQPNNSNLWEMRGDALFSLVSKDKALKDQLKELNTGNGKNSETVLKNTLNNNQAFSEGIASYQKVLLLDPMRSTAIGEKMLINFKNFDINIEPDELLHR